MSDRLKKIMTEVDNQPLLTLPEIKKRLGFKNSDERLKGLVNVRKLIQKSGLVDELFEIGLNHIEDKDNDCRWQAVIITGEYLELKPNDTWEIIMRYGQSQDDDMRSAIGTVLLEHYFERNPTLFNEKFRELKKEIRKGKKNLKKTLATCWSDFGSESNKRKVEQFLQK